MFGPSEFDSVLQPRRLGGQTAGGRHDLAAKRDAITEEIFPKGISHYRGIPAFGLLQHAAEQIPSRDAIVYGEKRWSYRDLNADSVRAAAMLQRLGIAPGDRVGLLLPNVPEYIIAANAIWRAGGVVLAISPLMVASEVEKLLEKTKCRYVICLDLLSSLLPKASDDVLTTLLVSIRKHLPAHEQLGYLLKRGYQQLTHRPDPDSNRVGWFWEEMEHQSLGRRTEDAPANAWQPISITPESDPAYILPTGGTTGDPKAVTLSHQNMVANAWQQYEWTQRSFGEETMLGVLPFFHSYGMSATVMGGAAMGATLVLHHRYQTVKTIQLIEQFRPSVFHAVPAMLVAMNARLRERPSQSLDSIRWVISGGAPLEESVAREFTKHCAGDHCAEDHCAEDHCAEDHCAEDHCAGDHNDESQGPQVVEGYGLSEASPVTHVGHLFDRPQYGRIGLPLPETDCRVVSHDQQGRTIDVDDGEVGELLVRGPQCMLGYWNDPTSTRNVMVDGWLHTGDLAMRHPDGWYSIVGRSKDLIITSGFNVYPSDVEAALCECEQIADACVVGFPDKERGELVHAFIVTEGNQPMDVDAIEQHCRSSLSAHKRPRKYTHYVGELPRNFLGKLIRRQLRESNPCETEAVS
ncbi:MAG: AMP-binding protein [Planctomycetota bacterium]